MIDIKEKYKCCGCEACIQVCPQQCISMTEDSEGFRYPKVDIQRCIGCILCEKVCPVINQSEPRRPIVVKAAVNPDEDVRMASSSGGVFSLLAENVIRREGVVFGVRFDEDWSVMHDYAETLDGLLAFRGSKYLQSRIGKSYRKAEYFLKQGRCVLFSGTACQIAGLKKFLRRDYENLYTIDVVCHGVPSPKVWKSYLQSKFGGKIDEICSVNFRNKLYGWKDYGLQINCRNGKVVYEPFRESLFMKCFLKDLDLRPSCYDCPAKGGKSGSDITLGDFWGVQRYFPELDDDKGLSAVMINSEKGKSLFEAVVSKEKDVSYESVFAGNPSIERSVGIPEYREDFWKQFERGGIEAVRHICRKMEPGFFRRNFKRVKSIIKGVL